MTKQYTFIDGVSYSFNGKTFNFTTVKGLFVKPEVRRVNVRGEEKLIVRGSIPISNRTKTINKLFGTSIPETEETVWLRTTFWDNAAERMKKIMDKGAANILMLVTGNVSVGEYNGKVQLDLSVRNFELLPTKRNQQEDTQSSVGATNQQPPADALPVPGFEDFGAEFSVADDDCPF